MAAAPAPAPARSASVFGNAKPREQVLAERGEDVLLLDAALDAGMTVRDISGGGGGEQDEWHMVTGGRRGGGGAGVGSGSRSSHERGGGGAMLLLGADEAVLIGGGGGSGGGGYGGGGMRSRGSGYRHHNGRGGIDGGWGEDGAASGDEAVLDVGVFRRALPTREVPLVL